MDASGASTQAGKGERDHLELAHHEICTALTVLCSNVELVRIRLRDAPLPDGDILAYLDELEGAARRLREVAHEMKRRHDGIPAGSVQVAAGPPGGQETVPAQAAP